MNYPLRIHFKTLALANQGSVTDSTGSVIFFVKQKAFKLREAITVFTDQTQETPLCTIKANKIIDFSAQYFFANMSGDALGSVKRAGVRSLWKADYTTLDNDGNPVMKINEENGWVKVLDTVLKDIPVAGMFSGLLFNPSYLVTRPDGTPIARIKKEAAFFEGKFKIEKLGEIEPEEELRFLLGCFTSILLERFRG
ncbi:MAG TPA: hypothetical protein VGO11_22885 [Chthoniobacteraceae bacterium]|jgi:uncharacterized protein YxjI|nr:hypothetical protein [Chthoniobacteraceae bacterium]